MAEGLGEGLGEGRAVGAEVEPALSAGLSAPDGEGRVELVSTTEDGEAADTTGGGSARGTEIAAAVGVLDATLVPVELLGTTPSAPVERVQPASDIIEAIKPRDAADSR
ncbi:MAG: hypothetical protein ACR2M5_15130 [Nakamurella sp.]